jgi:tetratricopeptide (TPR) repeat protein
MFNETPSRSLTWLAAPLVAFAALLATLTLINRGPSLADGGTDVAGPTPAEAAVARGDAYYQRSRETGDGRFYELAERAYGRALAADPANAGALAGRATIALAQHRFADGLELARRAHRAAPAVVAPYAAFVDGLIETGRYRAAGAALDRMLSLKPTLAAYSRLSYYRELHGDMDGAAQALRFAISAGAATQEGSAYIRSLLGDLQAVRGRYSAAAQAYRESLAVDPGYGRATAGLALLEAGRGKLDGAIATLRAQLGDEPSPDALTQLGELEEAAGMSAIAERRYGLASELEAEGLREGAGYDAGVTLNEAEHGDPQTAVRYGRRAWQSAPSVSSADAYSWALYRAGRIEAASRLSPEALRLGSRDPEFGFHAGMIAAAAGDEKRARALLSRLLERTPRFNALYAPQAEETLAELR